MILYTYKFLGNNLKECSGRNNAQIFSDQIKIFFILIRQNVPTDIYGLKSHIFNESL